MPNAECRMTVNVELPNGECQEFNIRHSAFVIDRLSAFGIRHSSLTREAQLEAVALEAPV
jgi:hypothetical protein